MKILFVLQICLFIAASAPVLAETQTIHCPTDPPVVRRLELQEQWRIDPDDAEAPLLGYFNGNQILVHEDRIYMLDVQLCHILVYTADGQFLHTILREGDGPGEVRNPGAMFLCRDGRIAVQHGYPSSLEFVDLEGTPEGRWRLGANSFCRRIQETSLGWFTCYTVAQQRDNSAIVDVVFYAADHDAEGRRSQVYHTQNKQRDHEKPGQSDEAEEFNPWYSAVAVNDGQFVLPTVRDQYRLEWRNSAGETTRIVTRDYTAHKRTKDELDGLKYRSYSLFGDSITFKDRKLCSHEPVISEIDILPDGALRVRTSLFEADLEPGMVCRYEVHEPTGELRERVEIYDPSGTYDVDYDVIALLDDNRAMILRNFRPAGRAAIQARLHPKVLEKLPAIPDDREDVAFVPIMCELVMED